MKTNLTIFGLEIEMEEPEESIFEYLDSFFGFDSLLYYIRLTGKGRRRYKEDSAKTRLQSILMCTKHNKDFQKYDMFYLKCDEWDIYYNEMFIGFDRTDLNKAIAKLVAKYTQEVKGNE